MNNIHLERDHKTENFQLMKLERREATNEIIAIDGSVCHHYKYKSRKKLNEDWLALHTMSTKKINMKAPIKKGDKFKVLGLDMFKYKTFTAAKVSRPSEKRKYHEIHTEENSFPFVFFYPHQIELVK